MKNQRKLFEAETKKLLKHIILNGELPNKEEMNMQVLKECCENKWISGVVTQTKISGRIVAEVRQTVTVTKSGLEYLYPKWDTKFIISSAIAAASLIGNLFQMFL